MSHESSSNGPQPKIKKSTIAGWMRSSRSTGGTCSMSSLDGLSGPGVTPDECEHGVHEGRRVGLQDPGPEDRAAAWGQRSVAAELGR